MICKYCGHPIDKKTCACMYCRPSAGSLPDGRFMVYAPSGNEKSESGGKHSASYALSQAGKEIQRSSGKGGRGQRIATSLTFFNTILCVLIFLCSLYFLFLRFTDAGQESAGKNATWSDVDTQDLDAKFAQINEKLDTANARLESMGSQENKMPGDARDVGEPDSGIPVSENDSQDETPSMAEDGGEMPGQNEENAAADTSNGEEAEAGAAAVLAGDEIQITKSPKSEMNVHWQETRMLSAGARGRDLQFVWYKVNEDTGECEEIKENENYKIKDYPIEEGFVSELYITAGASTEGVYLCCVSAPSTDTKLYTEPAVFRVSNADRNTMA